MRYPQLVPENKLAAYAKRFRIRAGKTKAAAAREMGVSRATMQHAENYPQSSLTKLRIRMIERYSAIKVVGPMFLLESR